MPRSLATVRSIHSRKPTKPERYLHHLRPSLDPPNHVARVNHLTCEAKGHQRAKDVMSAMLKQSQLTNYEINKKCSQVQAEVEELGFLPYASRGSCGRKYPQGFSLTACGLWAMSWTPPYAQRYPQVEITSQGKLLEGWHGLVPARRSRCGSVSRTCCGSLRL